MKGSGFHNEGVSKGSEMNVPVARSLSSVCSESEQLKSISLEGNAGSIQMIQYPGSGTIYDYSAQLVRFIPLKDTNLLFKLQ